MRDFAGKVAVVTGGASGIGLALATRLAEEGVKVVLADVEEPVLEAAVTKLRQQEHDVLGVVTDVSKPESVEALARKTLDAYGKVNIFCNNAGVGGGGSGIWGSTLKDWQWTVGVNLWGVVHGVRTFVPLILENGEEGHIVNTASIAGLAPGSGIYGVTKHAVVALSESLYDGLRQVSDKVHCSVLCPGLIKTRISESARNRPDELKDDTAVPPTASQQERRDRIAKLTQERGMEPSQLAGIVVEAIKDERFYILTHNDFDETIRTRMEDILQRRNPGPHPDLAAMQAAPRDDAAPR